MRFGNVKLARRKYDVKVGEKTKKKKGKKEKVEVRERFSLFAPIGYDIRALRTRINEAFNLILNGANKVELILDRFPQVHTVVGELKSRFPRVKFTAKWTTDEEQNTLFVIEREK